MPIALFANVLDISGNLYYSSKKSARTVGIDPFKKIIFVTDGKDSLLISKIGNTNYYEFKKALKEATFALTLKRDGERLVLLHGRRVTTGISNKTKEFICPLSDSKQNNKLKLLSSQISEIVSSSATDPNINFDNLIDESCAELDDSPDIKKVVSSSLSIADNPILKCFSDPGKKMQLQKVASEEDLLKLKTEVIQNANTNKFPAVSCKEAAASEKEIFANYLSDRITLFTDKGKIRADVCNSIGSNVLHEYLHHLLGGEKSDSSESFVKDIEKICWIDFGGAPDQKESCSIDAEEAHSLQLENKKIKEADSERGVGKGFTATDLTFANNEIKLEDNENAQKLVQSLPQASFANIQLSDSGWNSIAPQKPGTVSPSARQAIQAANSSFSSLTSIANQAIGILSKEAQAETPTKPASSPAVSLQVPTSGGPTIVSSRSLPTETQDGFETVQEYLVGDSVANKAGLRASAPAQQAISTATPASNQTVRAKAGVTPASDPKAVGNSNSTEIANLANAGSGSGSGGAAANVPQNFKPQSKSSSRSAPAQSGSSRQPASAQDGVQLLTAKTEVSGQDYRLIRRLYNDQSFKADLINRRIHIKTRAATLGVDPSRATHVFEDDGTKLKKIGGQ